MNSFGLKSLNKKVLRSRLDGANFTANIPFNPDNFGIKLINNKSIKQDFNLDNLFRLYSNLILRVFSLKKENIKYSNNKIIISDTTNIGIYCELLRVNYDLQIRLQFKGLFFTRKNPISELRDIITHLSIELNTYFYLTLIDAAKDILLKPQEILPINSENNSNYFYYSFKHEFKKYSEQRNNQIIDTGFEFRNSRFKLKLYDKRTENDKSKNEAKKEYYRNQYSKFKDDKGNLLPVTRFELTLRQNSAKQFTNEILNSNITEQSLISIILNKFSSKHSLRENINNSNDKNRKRWPINKNWNDLFNTTEALGLNKPTLSDHRFSNPRINIDTQLKKLVDAITIEEVINGTRINKELLLKKMHPYLEQVIKDSIKKVTEYDRSQLNQEFNLEKLKARASIKQLGFLGDSL